ncbi:unnamed protein product [Pleuronectes platessa]|uniref:Uncharacterized protein n=1 Tax=Pleuronectes platessa TaxID=8262 RepID=A0A9N7U7S0_PLEPL|nr:unnamed protein product [Pleuronectes platessa]
MSPPPCSTPADPLGVADLLLKTTAAEPEQSVTRTDELHRLLKVPSMWWLLIGALHWDPEAGQTRATPCIFILHEFLLVDSAEKEARGKEEHTYAAGRCPSALRKAGTGWRGPGMAVGGSDSGRVSVPSDHLSYSARWGNPPFARGGTSGGV